MSYSNVDPPLLLTSSARFISEGGGPIGCSNACNAAGRFNDLRVLLRTDFQLISDTIKYSFISTNKSSFTFGIPQSALPICP